MRLMFALIAVAAAASAQRPAVRRDPASVQFMITNSMKMSLMELGYSSQEIASLDPQRAAAIIEHNIRRTSQGVPKAWMRRGSRGSAGGLLQKSLAGVLKLAAAGVSVALALHFSGMDTGEFGRQVDELVRTLLDGTSSRRRY